MSEHQGGSDAWGGVGWRKGSLSSRRMDKEWVWRKRGRPERPRRAEGGNPPPASAAVWVADPQGTVLGKSIWQEINTVPEALHEPENTENDEEPTCNGEISSSDAVMIPRHRAMTRLRSKTNHSLTS